MDNQTVLLIGLGTLLGAGVVVSVGGWVLFLRDRREVRGTRVAGEPPAKDEPADGDGGAS